VDQQAFGRAADARAPGLGVHHHAQRFFGVGSGIDIDVHDPLEMSKDRHPRLGLHEPHEPLAAARHDHVDGVGHGQHLAHCGAVARGHQLNRIFGQAGGAQPLDQAGMDRGRGMIAFRATAQDHRVA